MNKFIIPLLTCCIFVANQTGTLATETDSTKDISTGTPKNQQVPESAKDELIRLLKTPMNLEQDQEYRLQRIQQLREHIAKKLSGTPPRTPMSQVSNYDVMQVGEVGKGKVNIDTEELINLALQHKRQNPGESREQIRENMSPSEIERAARAITELKDPNEHLADLNMSTDGILSY